MKKVTTTVGKMKKEPINTRCSPNQFLEVLGNLDLEFLHIDAIKKTPFGHFLSIPNICPGRSLLDVMLSRWDRKKKGFILGDTFVPFVLKDFGIILGLCIEGQELECKKSLEDNEKSDTKARIFKCEKIDRKSITKALFELKGGSLEDFVKVYIMFLFEVILFSTSNYAFNERLLRYIDRFEIINNFAWGKIAFDYLIESLDKASVRVQSRDTTCPSTSVGYLNGCAIVIKIWMFEHVGKFNPKSHEASPRLLKWVDIPYKHMSTYVEMIENLKSSEVLAHELTCTEEEYIFLSVRASQSEEKVKDLGKTEHEQKESNLKNEILRKDTEISFLRNENSKLREENVQLQKEISYLKAAQFHDFGVMRGSPLDLPTMEFVDDSSPIEKDAMRVKKGTKNVIQIGSIEKFVKFDDKDKRLGPLVTTPYVSYVNILKSKKVKVSISEEFKTEDPAVEETLLELLDGESLTSIKEFITAHISRDSGQSIVCTTKHFHITHDELQCIFEQDGWLSSMVIDVYLDLLEERQIRNQNKVFCAFIPTWVTQKKNIFEDYQEKTVLLENIRHLKRIFLPIHIDNHWLLISINVYKTMFEVYSSLSGYKRQSERYCKSLKQWFVKNGLKDIANWEIREVQEVPQQNNSNDCGVFMLKYIDCLSQCDDFDFDQANIPLIRWKILAQILRGRVD